jgi:hypothetical protein
MTGRRTFIASIVTVAVLAALPSAAAAAIPVRVRILKGSRQGPPAMDPKLADLQGQLGRLAYQQWSEVGQQQWDMDFGKSVSMAIPDGSTIELTLVSGQKDTVTFQVKVPQRKTNSRLTIAKDQRIVHQVTDEKAGAAYFATVRPWP